MKVVVADTSPLNYLLLIGEVDLLPRLYGRVLVPDIVVSELIDSEAPPAVRTWASHVPSWVDCPAHAGVDGTTRKARRR
ncbi:MAG TPA: hypothetical protein VKM93_14355 [Terriglobia bacterium]|nr:hypothetical protein [Terriglobia bacterium]